MKIEREYKYIIVGGGLAGMLLAWELNKQGNSFLVFSDDAPASSSVAAGTWNPVTFRRMIPTWRSQEMINAMMDLYPKVEKELGIDLISMIAVEKILANEQEADFWKEMAITEESKDFLVAKLHKLTIKGEEKHAGIVKQTGRIDLPTFVKESQLYFHTKGNLTFDSFRHSALKTSKTGIEYKDIKAKKIIFAEGTYAEQNPFFNWLPFKSVKGDVLTIKSKDLKVDKIRKKNIFILPLGNNTYKIGATYDWRDKTWLPSEKGKLEILEKFEEISDCTYEIIGHEAGRRPATHDRRPFIGPHPKNDNILIFNGLGSKGVFLGPLLALEFCNFLVGKGDIHQEVSVKRCFKKYFQEG